MDLAESKVFQIAEQRTSANEGPQPLKLILEQTVDKIEELFKTPHNGVTGVASGYGDLDKMTAGLQRSDLVIVAARPSMGKTTFAMNLCEHAALTADKPVLIFSSRCPPSRSSCVCSPRWGASTRPRCGPVSSTTRTGRGLLHHGIAAREGEDVHRRLLRPDPDRSAPVPVGGAGQRRHQHDHGGLPATDAGAGAV
ncbi:hypothetical protein H2136_05155 [Aeromonas hydrophila]|uniref:SF4 helicase domain-containing protein n=1 Tax=Aeromonas hydrophila TaxID=644 RepID=A0A926IYY5_AERHY|nr:hypothetical protein [Aeromonas hydrophila]